MTEPTLDLATLPTDSAAALERLDRLAETYQRRARADATLAAYLGDLTDWAWWCQHTDQPWCPTHRAVLKRYLTACADGRPFRRRRWGRTAIVHATLRPSSIRRRMAAIRFLHLHSGHADRIPELSSQDPQLRELLAGIDRTWTTRPHQAASFRTQELQTMLESLDHTAAGQRRPPKAISRDRALLLVGFAGGFRRSELVALALDDLRIAEDCAQLLLGRSKGDPRGRGTETYLARIDSRYCPTAALESWLAHRGTEPGPLFLPLRPPRDKLLRPMTPQSVNLILRRAAAAADLDLEGLSAHSLRRAYANAALRHGAAAHRVQRGGRWKALSSLGPYLDQARGVEDSVTPFLGL